MKKHFRNILVFICCSITIHSFAQDCRVRKNFDFGTILISVDEELNYGNEYDETTRPYQDDIVGIATGNTNPIKKSDLIVTSGLTEVKVNNENGLIKRGDLITSSSVSGVGMKATESGMVLGVALEDAGESGGLLKIRLSIQYVR